MKTRDIPTLTNPHLPLNNNGCNPPLSAIAYFSFKNAYAKRALARGDDAEEVMRRIADYRAYDKHDPEYYARRTVLKAQAEMLRTGTGPDDMRTEQARVASKGL